MLVGIARLRLLDEQSGGVSKGPMSVRLSETENVEVHRGNYRDAEQNNPN